jgi:hypothetical protein
VTPVGPNTSDGNGVVPVPVDPPVTNKLPEYYALEKRLSAERAKPLSQQNYADIEKELQAIADDKSAGKAARYAALAIAHIKRCELALQVAEASRLQDENLKEVMDGISKARAERLADFQDLGRFAVIGRLRFSNIYGASPAGGYYRVDDDSGKILCYAQSLARGDLSKLVDRKVGLVGTIEPHLATAGAVVRFTEIVELK